MIGAIDALYKRILLAAHPVGSVYQSTAATNPATLFGGTWEQIKGRFLLSMGAVEANTTDYWGSITPGSLNLQYVGETGGEVYHRLTVEEMPSHHHGYARGTSQDGYFGLTSREVQNPPYTGETLNTGGGQPHNNIPPYYVVYTWRRTA